MARTPEVNQGILDRMRQNHEKGSFGRVIELGQRLQSPASLMLQGEAHRGLGHLQAAHTTYSRAAVLYRQKWELDPNHRGKAENLFTAFRKVLDTSVLLGRYEDAATMFNRLATMGNPAEERSLRQPDTQLRQAAENAFAQRDYKKAATLATHYLGKTGKPDARVELILANSLLFPASNVPLDSLVGSYRVARRVLHRFVGKSQKTEGEAATVLGYASEIALTHPKRTHIRKGDAKHLLQSRLGVAAIYRRAADLDPANKSARERFKALAGKDYEGGFLSKLTEYTAPSYLPVSPRLSENRQAVFDEATETAWYWTKHDEQYRQFIDRLDAQIGHTMDPNCRVAICIPAFMEEQNIYRTLEAYTTQEGVNPYQFEIIVLENHPDKPEFRRDNTASEIARFKARYPQFRVHAVYHKFPEGATAMGNIRKTAFDLALRRGIKKRERSMSRTPDLILASNDADFYGMKPRALRFLIDTFDTKKELDLIAGKWDYPEEALVRFPTVHALIRFVRYYQTLHERYYGKQRTVSSGACSYFRTSTYAAIGGYEYTVKRGSDTELGIRMAYHRGDRAKSRVTSDHALRIFTDPRRSLSKMVVGKRWIDQWEDKDWQNDPRVRGKNWREFNEPTLTSFHRARLQEEMNAFLRKRLSAVANNPNSRTAKDQVQIIHEAMRFLGAGYRIENGRIVLTDTRNLEAGLLQYKQKRMQRGVVRVAPIR